MKKFFVIGSNSFSGSHFVNLLIEKNISVMGISRSSEPREFFLPYHLNPKKKTCFKFFKLDLNKNGIEIVKLIRKYKPSYIVNFASQSMVGQSWENPSDWYNTNVISSIKLIENIKNLKFIKKYTHISTPEVYGATNLNVTESENYFPSTPYAISRSCFDQHLMATVKNFGFPAVFTRAANVYGPYQELYRIIPRTIYSIFFPKKIILDGGGKSKRSFIHVKDVIDATYKITLEGKKGEIYHISNDKLISILDLVKKIFKISKKNIKNKIIIGKERIGKDNVYSLSSRKLKGLDWKPKINLENGLQDTIIWFEKYKDFLKKQNLKYVHKK